MNRPAGRISAICGVRREIRSMSASPRSRCRPRRRARAHGHAFVRPPSAATAIAFSNDALVRIDRRTAVVLEGVDERRGRLPDDRLARGVLGGRRGHPRTDWCPSASEMLGPSCWRCTCSRTTPCPAARRTRARSARRGSSSRSPARRSPRRRPGSSRRGRGSTLAGSTRRRRRPTAGRAGSSPSSSRRVLSQPAIVMSPSMRSAWTTSSTESAIQSREGSDARIPSVPIAIPSETEIGKRSGSTRSGLELVAGGDGELVEVHVARRHPVPRRADARLRQLQVLRRPAHRPQHRAGGRLRRPSRHLEAPASPTIRLICPPSTITCSSEK